MLLPGVTPSPDMLLYRRVCERRREGLIKQRALWVLVASLMQARVEAQCMF